MTKPSSLLMRAISISMWPVKRAASFADASPFQRPREYRLGIGPAQDFGVGGQGGVIGGGRAHRFEESAPLFQRLNESGAVMDIDAGGLAKQVDARAPAAAINIDDGIGPERGDDEPAPAGIANRLMMFQFVGRRVGGRQDLDIEALKQGSRAEFRARQALFNGVVNRRGVGAVDFEVDAEDISQLVAEPDAGRRGAEEMPIVADCAPDLPVVSRCRRRSQGQNPKLVQRYALRVQHAEDVMVGG